MCSEHSNNLSFDATRLLSLDNRNTLLADISATISKIESNCCLPNLEKVSGRHSDRRRDVFANFAIQRCPIVDPSIFGKISLREGNFSTKINRQHLSPVWGGFRSNSDIVASMGSIAHIKEDKLYDAVDISDTDMWDLLAGVPTTSKIHEKKYFLEIPTFLDGVDIVTRLTAASIYAKSPKSQNFYEKHGHKHVHQEFYEITVEEDLRTDDGISVQQNIKTLIDKHTGEVDLLISVEHNGLSYYKLETDPDNLTFNIVQACKHLYDVIPSTNHPLALL